jgi:hypothetical protein
MGNRATLSVTSKGIDRVPETQTRFYHIFLTLAGRQPSTIVKDSLFAQGHAPPSDQ